MRVPWQLAKIFSPYINEIQGQENIPINQFILASNHLSPIDSVLAILAVDAKLFLWLKEDYYKIGCSDS